MTSENSNGENQAWDNEESNENNINQIVLEIKENSGNNFQFNYNKMSFKKKIN